MENDTDTGTSGGDGLTIDQAAAAYAKSRTEAVQTDHADTQDEDGSDTSLDDLSNEPTEGENAEAEAEQEDDAATADDESAQGRFAADDANVRVRNDDGTYSITTVRELKRGNLREGDYTRKTQEASALKAQVESQSSAIRQRESELTQQADYMVKLVQSIIPAAPDPSMMQTDPMGYLQQKESREQWLTHLNYLQGTQTKAKADADAKSQSDKKSRSDKEWEKTLAVIPDFKDAGKTKAFVDQSFAWGEANGFSKQEMAEALAMDHRQLLTVRKAMAWDRLQASKASAAKKTDGKPPVIKGGNRPGPGTTQTRRATELRSVAQKTGRLDDVVAAFRASRK